MQETQDLGLIPGLERFPRVGNSNLLQYSCLENSIDGGAWQATIHGVTKSHGVAKSQTQLSMHTHTLLLSSRGSLFRGFGS